MTRTGTERVVYAGFATQRHSGGVHVLAEHVRLLRDAGVAAFLWLPGAPPAPQWLGEDLPMIFGSTTEVGASDLLVLPEVPVVAGADPAPGVRKIILNQNHFYTFAAWTGPQADYPGWSPDPSVWTVSGESARVLRALHPQLPVTVVPPPVDTELFTPAADKRGIAWLPKKRPAEAGLLRHLFERSGRIHDADLHELVDVGLDEVATTFAHAAVVVALSHSDGFGLPVAEAMSAGCLVVGYDGGGGVELFDAPGVWPIPEQRPLLLVEQALSLAEQAGTWAAQAAANRDWVRARHARSTVSRILLDAVQAALRRPGSAGSATHPALWLDRVVPNFTKSA